MKKSCIVLLTAFLISILNCCGRDEHDSYTPDETVQNVAERKAESSNDNESDDDDENKNNDGIENQQEGEENNDSLNIQEDNTRDENDNVNTENPDNGVTINDSTEIKDNNATSEVDIDNNQEENKEDDETEKEEEYEDPYIPDLNELPDLLFRISTFVINGQYHQSGACHGDYAIFISDYHSHFYLYNLKTKTMIYDLAYKTGIGTDSWNQTIYHCNQASFGVEYYEPSDPFPVLYVSQRAKEGLRCHVEAYRIIPHWNDEIGEYSSFDVECIQTIYFPSMTNNNALGNVNLVVDPENCQMFTYSRNNNKGISNSGKCKISCFDIPSIYSKEVYLEDDDVKWSFYPGCSAVNMQGGCINNGLLYIAQGYKKVGYIYLNIIDLNSRQQTGRLDLLNNGHTWEPEACFLYEGQLMLGGNKSIFVVSIE